MLGFIVQNLVVCQSQTLSFSQVFFQFENPLLAFNYFEKLVFLQQQKVQMQLGNKKQKLILNTMKKRQTPPKLQLNLRSILLPLQTQINTSQVKQQNSSKCLKEKENFIRCRSISSFIHPKNTSLKLSASKNGFSFSQKTEITKQILELCQQTVQMFKQKSKANDKDKYYSIASDDIRLLLLQFGQKIKLHCSQQAKDKNGSKSKRLKICKAVDINKMGYKSKELHLEQIFSLQLQPKQRNNKAQALQNKQQYIILFSNKQNQQIKIKELPHQISALSHTIDTKITQIKQLQQRVQEKEDYLAQLQKRLKDIIIFVDKQANKKLQAQTQQYKDSEKELFDFAFLFDRASLDQYTHKISNIMAPHQNIHLSIKQTANYQAKTYTISQDALRDYQVMCKKNYQSTIIKLKDLIRNKVCKIERFVAIMKKLASNTVSKRQYLTLINKKMAVTSVNMDRAFRKCQTFLTSPNTSQQVVDNFYKLKDLFVEIRNIYCQAQIFY